MILCRCHPNHLTHRCSEPLAALKPTFDLMWKQTSRVSAILSFSRSGGLGCKRELGARLEGWEKFQAAIKKRRVQTSYPSP
jgi:hypothetical protein